VRKLEYPEKTQYFRKSVEYPENRTHDLRDETDSKALALTIAHSLIADFLHPFEIKFKKK
jgi:hypothetical protein